MWDLKVTPSSSTWARRSLLSAITSSRRNVWASIAKDGPDAITGDDDEPKKKTKKAHKVSSSESSEMSDEAVAVEASTLDPLK